MSKVNLTCSVCGTTREVVRHTKTKPDAKFWCVQCQENQLPVVKEDGEGS